MTASRILKWHFESVGGERGVNEAQGYACEIVVWEILHHSSEHELIEYLLYELPVGNPPSESRSDVEANTSNELGHGRPPLGDLVDERSSLLSEHRLSPRNLAKLQQLDPHDAPYTHGSGDDMLTSFEGDPTLSFVGLNTSEMAAIADAKKLLSQPVVQTCVNGIVSIVSESIIST